MRETVSVYDIGNENFEKNGDAVLAPVSGTHRQAAGGNYELTMVHPIDPEGKWRHLVPGAIVKVPVPVEVIANSFSGYAADIYKTNTAAELRADAVAPAAIGYQTWSDYAAYEVGDKVSCPLYWGHKNYQATYWDGASDYARVPPYACSWWKEIPDTTSGAQVLVALPSGTELYLVEDYSTAWYKMSTYYGLVGYIEKSKVTFDRHVDPGENKPRVIREQLFRLKEPTVDNGAQTVTVTGQHVSYDLAGALIGNISVSQATPAMALGRMMENLMIPYRGTVATDMVTGEDGTYTGDMKGKNGVFAIMDPDTGIVGTFDAKLTRDNWDWFVMKKRSTDRGFRIRYGVNAKGITWKKSSANLVNRIVPVAKDAGGQELMLPEKWVDSEDIGDYPVILMERLQVQGQVGKDKGTGDGSVWTESDLLDEMRAKAAERFSIDRADQIAEEVTVQVELLEDTAEYAWMKGYHDVLLYDTVKAVGPRIGLEKSLYISEIEYDFVKQKITGLKITGGMKANRRSVTGYNVANNSITANKLTDSAKSELIQAAVDVIPEYSYPESARPGVIDSLTSTSATDALSANQGRVLNGLKARKIVMNNTVDTWAKVWAIIDTLEVRETATLYAVSGAYALLSGGATSEMMAGTITRVGQTDQFEIIAKTTNNRLICARITGASSSSAGTYEEINYSSRLMGSNDNPITSLANIPLNSSGNMILAAAISPAGSLGSFAYWKHGNDDTRWSIMAIYEQNNRAYINSYANSAYGGWRELVSDKLSTFRAVSNNSSVTFTIPSGSHAIVMIGTDSVTMFMTSQNVLSTGTMPSGFTASNSGTSVTVTRDNSTAYVCSVIIVPA